ncbi:hypothetical protein [Jiangella alkaliphila]|uniref:F420-0:Gamma-glutamyl ligase n=1 Tax=Jiangella alkaliphila TaxID=419479 RepID=A0A1H2K087_9ACTN|nr:hypothetical protein [Jiangella alkaliphila]SDU62109.1 hypothetical protein SAMN04488563_3279 [Jiangella alkaliphila]
MVTGAWTRSEVAGAGYLRHAVRTRWFTEDDDLRAALREALPRLEPGDTVVLSEKATVFLTGRGVPIDELRPGRLATLLARSVRPRPGSRGLSVPEKMQYVVRTTGGTRILAAALAGAVTRPLGLRGVFYRVAGPVARDIDGGRPPYEHLVLPPLTAAAAAQLCRELEAFLGAGVAIVDLNDYGGSIRAVSPLSLPADVLFAALSGNPLGQRAASTPFGIVRPLGSGPSPGTAQQPGRVAQH